VQWQHVHGACEDDEAGLGKNGVEGLSMVVVAMRDARVKVQEQYESLRASLFSRICLARSSSVLKKLEE
jgi:hypothetical protein